MQKNWTILKGLLILAALGIPLIMKTLTTKPTESNQPELQSSVLSKHIEMGVVELNVKDMAVQKNFYVDLVGLSILEEKPAELTLGFYQRQIIRLVHTPELPLFDQKSAGLYHTAIVFESKPALARAIQSVLTKAPHHFTGSSDHVVSEAFYFTDPEGNGVELYTDRPASSWIWDDGKITMGSTYIDPAEYIAKYANASSDEKKKMGHVHLQIGSMAEAKTFYSAVLGMHLTAEMPTALFLSDGKYHHHLGMNIWQSAGAGKRTASTGLRSFEMQLAEAEDLNRLKERLTKASIPFEEADQTITVRDPWETVILFSVKK